LDSLNYIQSYRTSCSSTLEIELNTSGDYYTIVFLENSNSCEINENIFYQHKFTANVNHRETNPTFSDSLSTSNENLITMMSYSEQSKG